MHPGSLCALLPTAIRPRRLNPGFPRNPSLASLPLSSTVCSALPPVRWSFDLYCARVLRERGPGNQPNRCPSAPATWLSMSAPCVGQGEARKSSVWVWRSLSELLVCRAAGAARAHQQRPKAVGGGRRGGGGVMRRDTAQWNSGEKGRNIDGCRRRRGLCAGGRS